MTTLQNAPVPPSVVAQKVLEIASNGTWQLRHLVGPDAVPLIEWRKGMTDEKWVELHSLDDDKYREHMGAATGK